MPPKMNDSTVYLHLILYEGKMVLSAIKQRRR